MTFHRAFVASVEVTAARKAPAPRTTCASGYTCLVGPARSETRRRGALTPKLYLGTSDARIVLRGAANHWHKRKGTQRSGHDGCPSRKNLSRPNAMLTEAHYGCTFISVNGQICIRHHETPYPLIVVMLLDHH
jgi:hypothetical protein